MLAAEFEYVAPDSLEEALGHLEGSADARVLAGGQSLIPVLKQRLARPELLVDLSRIRDLRDVRETEDGIAVGAMTPHAAVASAGELTGGARVLAEAARAVGDLQVRNRGTLGGSLAHADPAADLPAAVLALEATLVARSAEGEREIAADEFFLGPWTTALEPGEILTEIRLPGWTTDLETGGAYEKLEQKASGFALVGVAAVVDAADGRCRRARVAVTGAASSPQRLQAVEEALEGGGLDEESVRSACEGAGEPLEGVQEDIHASAGYRRAMTEVLARRAIGRAS